MKRLVGPFAQIVTMSNLRHAGPLSDRELQVLSNAGLLVENGIVLEVDEYERIHKAHKDIHLEECSGGVAIPGFIDAHTHICWSGSRADDYARRNSGMSYLEIAKNGGGIWSTVQKTRAASLAALTKLTEQRANQHLERGITTIEVKSGYGLSVAEELKQLEAIRSANEVIKADLVPTCLAGHIKPKDFDGSNSDYLSLISEELFPILIKQQLTNRIDAFVEQGAFSTAEIGPYFQKAKSMGFDLTVHADQFHVEGSHVAAQYGALSADHLEASDEQAILALVKTGVIAVALPGASMGLGCEWAPARKILDSGGSLAIASDWNPGSAPMGNLLTQASVLGCCQKLSNAEVLAGITVRAGHALNLHDRGVLQKGMKADFIRFETDDYREILYHQGQMSPSGVWKDGQLITQKV